jgi:copper resistance protein B
MRAALFGLAYCAALALPGTPLLAQDGGHEGHHAHHGQAPAPAEPPPVEVVPDPHQHHAPPSPPPAEAKHVHDHGPVITSTAAPVPPTDHAADALFDPAAMARARAALRKEHGDTRSSKVTFDLAELQLRKGRNGYRWEGEAWFGGDIDRLKIRHEGEGGFGEPIDDLEIQALWSHAITPNFDLEIGLRHDIVPNPSRSYAVVGIEGVAPYWIHLGGQLFVSDKGDFHARIEAGYDERITQRLILQPRAELNFAAQDVPELGLGAGLTDYELGLRLRYEIRRELAPYLGIEWSAKSGTTARLARLEGEDPDTLHLVAGLRAWF